MNGYPVIRNPETKMLRALWEDVFQEDSEAFLDYYDKWKRPNQTSYGIVREGKLLSMADANPYRVRLRDQTFDSAYLIAVATRKEHRHQGMMTAILRTILMDLAEKKLPFVYLMPADPAIYEPFGFQFFGIWQTGTLTGAADQFHAKERIVSGTIEKAAARLLSREDYPAAGDWMNAFLSRYAECTPVRDDTYMRLLYEELRSEDGGLYEITREGTVLGYASVWGGGEPEIREILCEEPDAEAVRLALLLVMPSLEGAPVLSASFPMEEKPVIMGRISSVKDFLELFSAERDGELVIRVEDSFLPAQNGSYRWTFRDGKSHAEKTKEHTEEHTEKNAEENAEENAEAVIAAEDLFLMLMGIKTLTKALAARGIIPVRGSVFHEIV